MVKEPKKKTKDLNIELFDLPNLEIVETQDDTSLYPDLDAYWFLLDPQRKIYRFIYHDQIIEEDEKIDYTERFRPILLIHGFNSSFTTWNWMVQRLWADGFRNIFAMKIFSYTTGLPRLFEQLTHAIDQILSLLPNYDFLTIIGHSMGGMVSRYYLKQESEEDCKVRLCVTLGAPHYGIRNILKPFANIAFTVTSIFLPSKKELLEDFSITGRMKEINKKILTEDLYKTTMVNIMGSVPMLAGTDGFFKPKNIADMINLKVPTNHFMLNKTEASYQTIQDILLNQVKLFKLRLLYIEVPTNKDVSEREYFLRISQEDKPAQRYPISGYIELTDRIYIPKEPVIIYVGMSSNTVREVISIEVFQKDIVIDPKITHQEVEILLSSTDKIIDYIIITTPNNTKFALAYVSYVLKHTYNH